MMVPIGVQAWDTVTFQSHTEGVSSTNMTQKSSNVHYLDLDLSSIDTDVTFMFYVSNGHGNLGRNDDATENFDLSSASSFTSYGHKGSSNTWTLKHSTSKYAKYKITAEWKSVSGDVHYWDIKIEGTEEKSSGGDTPATGDNNFYLVGNFFNNETSINYNKRYFKFNKQNDGSYMVEIPASLTANMQILSVDGSTTAVYGPGSIHGIHADSGDGNGGWPATDGNVTGNLTKSTTLALNNNYWELTTRNNNTSAGDDDGLYEVSFTLNSSGVPSNWTIKHVSTKRVVYFLSTATGAVATPLYDKRNNANAAYTNATKGYLHFDASNQYWVLSNIVYKDIIDDTGDYYCGTNLGAHKNNRNRDILPTTNKLVYKGNGNRVFATDKYGNEVSPNEQAIAANYLQNNQNATYEVQYNPSNGDGDLAKSHWGMRGQIQFLGGTSADDNIKTVSMVGPAIPGTTSGSTWTWDSTVGDMTWDVTENCYKLTLTTTAAAGQHFRFVANHTQAKNFYETNTTARIPYDGTATSGTSAATEEDPNDVAYTTSGTTSYTESSYDILFNRPAGEWTVRFYLTYDKDQNKSFYYTITGTENTDPDATLTPGTTTWDSYTLNDAKTLTVTLNNDATGYKYSYGAGTTPRTSGTSTAFGDLSYDGTDVKLGSTVVASGTNTVTIRIQGTDGTTDGAIHDYTYTFNPAAATLDFTPKSGFFINKAVITVTNGTAPYTYTITDDSDNVLRTGTSSSATFTISTPGKLTVTDKAGNSAPSSEKFDFTYSTSENYANYYNNGTTAQSVAQEGGADATNIFLKKNADYKNMRIYAWDDTYDQLIQEYQKGKTTTIDSELSELGLTQSSESNWKDIWENGKFIRSEQGTGIHTYNDTRAGFLERDPYVMLTEPYPGTLMSDSRSITIDGEEYYYLTLPLNRLHFANSEVGIIVTRNDDSYTDLGKNADLYKTADYVISSNSSFIYSSVKNSDDTYTNRIFDISELVEPNGNIIFFDNSKVKWSNVYCYAWKDGNASQHNAAWPGVLMADYGNDMYIEEVDPTLYDRIQFNNGSSSQTPDISDFGSGKYVYTYDGANVNKTVKTVNQDRYNTYITTPSKYTVEVQNHPNGDDYLKAMPSDKTVLLDPTWGGVLTSPLTNLGNEETSVPNWNGVSGSVPGYRKMIPTTLTQTVYGLDNSKTYTVQAIVRVWGELHDKVALKVGDGDAVECEAYNSSGISYVNKNGRVDDRYSEGPDPADPYFISGASTLQGWGWQKIEASGKPTAAGNLVITLTPTFVGSINKYDLADVILLEEANTAGNYWTKLPTDATSVAEVKAGEIDLRDRTTYNAFSFFDRNEGNPNAMIKASNRTVIGLRSGIADVQAADGTVSKDAVDHIQSRNTISLNEGSTTDWSGRYLYLYDESSDWSDCNAYGATVGFKMMGAKYDRQFTANQHSTMFLPFAVTTEQLKTAGFKELQMVDVNNVTSANIPLITWDLTKETPTSYTTTAGQGYIVIAGDNGASLSSFIKGGIDVQAANSEEAKKTEATGLVGAYVYCTRNQTETVSGTTYMNYSYLNDKFRALATAAQGGAEIKPFRATFAVPMSVAGGARMLSTFIIDADEVFTPTGVDKLGVEEQLSGNIYTLDGRLVSTNGKLSELSRGIYVRGGRKIVVK